MIRRRLGLLISAGREAAPLLGVLAFVLIPASQIFVALEALWMRNLIDGAIRADMSTAVVGAVLLGASRGFEAFLLVPASYVQMTFGERVGIVVNRRVAYLIARAPGLELHEDPETQDRLALLRDPAGFASIVFRLAGGVGTVLGFIATVALLASVHPVLAVTPLLAVPGIYANQRGNKITRAAQESAAVHERLARHYSGLATRPIWNKEVRVFGLGERVRDRQREEAFAARDVRAGAVTRASLLRLGASVVTNAGLAVALVFVATLAVRGTRTPGELVLAALLLTRMSRVVEELHNFIGASQEHVRTIDRYVWLEERVREHLRTFGEASSAPPAEIREAIRFEDVSFRYDGADVDVLRGLDLTIPAGSVIAIVGDNGAGKTTLVKLLSRFYHPTTGRILVDGVDIANVDAAAWREEMTGGFQDFARFELPVRESVGVGDLAAITAEDRLERAMAAAGGGLDAALPDGLDTQLGPTWPGGVDLSTGQWQRVALARAWLREHALVTVLDEPTASLDAETEHDLYLRARDRARDEKSRGEITVLISHRFTTVAMADLIAVLDEGRITELGSHDALMARDGTYAELYRLHAAGYE